MPATARPAITPTLSDTWAIDNARGELVGLTVGLAMQLYAWLQVVLQALRRGRGHNRAIRQPEIKLNNKLFSFLFRNIMDIINWSNETRRKNISVKYWCTYTELQSWKKRLVSNRSTEFSQWIDFYDLWRNWTQNPSIVNFELRRTDRQRNHLNCMSKGSREPSTKQSFQNNYYNNIKLWSIKRSTAKL
jgi:hypothetical protein